jgi:hypothetical protein
VDIISFEVLVSLYAKDAKSIYCKGIKVEWAEPKTFIRNQTGEWLYYKDNKSVFLDDKKVEWADPKTFEEWANSWWIDAKYVYHNGVRAGADEQKNYNKNKQIIKKINAR